MTNTAVVECVLIYGHDKLLLSTRAQVVQTLGLRACGVATRAELLEALKAERCVALVLCHTLREDEALEAIVHARAARPDVKVIALESGWSSTTLDHTDGVVAYAGGPHQFLDTLSRLVATDPASTLSASDTAQPSA